MSSAGATQGRISHAPCTLACLRHILEKGARVAPQGACSFRRSDILNLTPSGDLCSFVLRGKYTVYAVGGVQQEKHGSLWEQCQPMPGRAPFILQSRLSSENIGMRLVYAREKQQRA